LDVGFRVRFFVDRGGSDALSFGFTMVGWELSHGGA
jgi:hypothetical protein